MTLKPHGEVLCLAHHGDRRPELAATPLFTPRRDLQKAPARSGT